MPDGFIQQTRVGVTSALGIKVIARKNSEVLALIGSGGQAHAHFRFLTFVRPIKRVKSSVPIPSTAKLSPNKWKDRPESRLKPWRARKDGYRLRHHLQRHEFIPPGAKGPLVKTWYAL